MIYTTLNAGKKEYKLRMTASSVVEAEERLGQNPVMALSSITTTNFSLKTLMVLLHCALVPLNANITLEDAYKIYDEYIDDGNSLEDLVELFLKVLEVSGFTKKEAEKANEAKNEKGTAE